MRQYVVTKGCYVPVGDQGGVKFKVAGQVVTLDEKDAKALGDLVKPASKRVVEQQVAGQTRVQAEGVGDSGPSPQDEPDDLDEPDESDAPNPSDVKADWVDFAVAQGESRETAEAMTKGELVDKFG